MNWRNLLSGALFAAATITATSASAASVTVMVFQGMQNLPMLAAIDKGFFAKKGIEVDLKFARNSGEMRNGLADGAFQIVHGGVDNAIAMVEVAKKDVAVVMGGDDAFNRLFVRPDIKSVKDLAGKEVIVDAVDTAYAFQLYAVLEKNGLRKGDYQVKPVGATAVRVKAMLDGVGSASILNPPFTIMAEKGGMKDLGVVTDMIGPYQGTAAFVMKDWAKANRALLVNYLAAYVEGLRWSLDPANRAEATKLFVDKLKLEPDVAARAYELAVAPKTGLTPDAKFDLAGMANVLKLRSQFTGAAETTPQKYIDLSFYEDAIASLKK